MLRNYLKTALRNMNKNKVFTLINISGLAVGLCCCLLIFMYVADEMSFDRFHTQKDSIFRVLSVWHKPDGSIQTRGPSQPVAAAPFIEDYFPEIDHVIRFATGSGTVKRGSLIANETVSFTDSEVFQTFSFPLLKGQAAFVLRDPKSVVLTEGLARKYFGKTDPLGERLTITFGNNARDFIVTGVAADIPRHSTIQFSMLVPIVNLPSASYKEVLTALGDFSFPLYIHLKEGVDSQRITSRLDAFVSQTFAQEFQGWKDNDPTDSRKAPISYELQSLPDMHFDKNCSDGTNPSTVFLLTGVGLVIMLIAGINFVNLSIGRSGIRLMEIGMRKVIGASRKQLIHQFWSESALLVLFSLMLGIALAGLFLPVFGQLSGKAMAFSEFLRPVNLAGMAGLLLVVTFGSCSYPALVLSGVDPVHIFRGRLGPRSRSGLQKSLIVLQFTLSVFLIITTLFLGRQIRFMVLKDPGYEKSGLISVRTQVWQQDQAQAVVDNFRMRVRSIPQVLGVSASSTALGLGTSRYGLTKDDERIPVYQVRIDADYLSTLGIQLKEGRNFSRDREGDRSTTIVNEEFCRILQIEDPLGHKIGEFAPGPKDHYPFNLEIIGVMEDIHILSFKHGIQPMMLHMQPGWGIGNMIVRIRADSVSETMEKLETAWTEVRPDKPFVYSFTEDDLESQYRTEKKWGAIVRYSSIFAVIIACMGIFGLTTLAVNRRFKEIGIRKVLGAGVVQILRLITFEFVLLIAIANVVAWPAAFAVVDRILKNYHYRISVGPQYFLLAFSLTLAVALGTIGYLALKASLSDPVKALRYE